MFFDSQLSLLQNTIYFIFYEGKNQLTVSKYVKAAFICIFGKYSFKTIVKVIQSYSQVTKWLKIDYKKASLILLGYKVLSFHEGENYSWSLERSVNIAVIQRYRKRSVT